MTREILVCDMEFRYKNTSRIHNVTFIFQNFQKNFKSVKKNYKIPMDFEKLITSFEVRKSRLLDYLWDNFFFSKIC